MSPNPEKELLSILVNARLHYNKALFGDSFYENSKPYAQTTNGGLGEIEPNWNHAVLFEIKLMELISIWRQLPSNRAVPLSFQHQIQKTLVQALEHLVDNMLAYNSNYSSRVEKLLYAAYVCGSTSKRMYEGTSVVNVIRQLIAHSINTKQHAAPLFFTLFERFHDEFDFSLAQMSKMYLENAKVSKP